MASATAESPEAEGGALGEEPPAEASAAGGEAEPSAEPASVEELMAAASDKASEIEAGGAMPLPPGPPPLPAGWVEATDPRYNNATYWFHEVTKETSWVRPSARTGAPPPPPQGPPLPSSAPPGTAGGLISTLAPPPGETHYGEKDMMIEGKLDEWVKAKRAKDFGTSDRLREELRELGSRGMGVDPDLERPVKARRVTLGEGVDVSLDEEQQLVRYTPLPCPYLAAHPYLAVLRPFALLHPAVPSHPSDRLRPCSDPRCNLSPRDLPSPGDRAVGRGQAEQGLCHG